jgi:hypothetical protein
MEGVPQRLPNRLLVDLERGTDGPKTHPQPPRLLASPAIRRNRNGSCVNTAITTSTSATVRIGRNRFHQIRGPDDRPLVLWGLVPGVSTLFEPPHSGGFATICRELFYLRARQTGRGFVRPPMQ